MATHFIVYSVRSGVENFFRGITDPSFFAGINRILDDELFLGYVDPLHEEDHQFPSLFDFVTAEKGLGIGDWVTFMKALQAQSEGTAAKRLYWRMVEIDSNLNPLAGEAAAAQPLALMEVGVEGGKAGPGRGNKTDSNTTRFTDRGQAYILRRLARDAPDVLERVKAGEFKSARAAAIKAGIITPFPSLQLKDPAPTAQKLLAKKGRDWCLELLEELSELVLAPSE